MKIVVTHLTRMGDPHICLAGIDKRWKHWRPVLASRKSGDGWKPHRRWLRSVGGPFHLGSKVDLGDVRHEPVPPDVEDAVVDVKQVKFIEDIDREHFLKILDRLAQDSIRSIFGTELESRGPTSASMPVGAGERSLGILRLSGAELKERFEPRKQKQEIRLVFEDPDFDKLGLNVTDLRLWEDYNNPKTDRVKRIQGKLDDCLVAIGLTGAWGPDGEEKRHWLQINNIYPRSDPLWERE